MDEGQLNKDSFVFVESNNLIGLKPVKKLCTLIYNPKEDISNCLTKAENFHDIENNFLEKEQYAKIEILKSLDHGNALLIRDMKY
jgi:hypothetical protein